MNINIFSRAFPPDCIGGGEISTFQVAKQLRNRHAIEIYSLSSRAEAGFLFHHLKSPNGLTEIFPGLYTYRIQHINNLPPADHLLWGADYFGALASYRLQNKKIFTVRDYLPICPGGTATLCDYSFCDRCTLSSLSQCLRIKEAPLLKKLIRCMRYSLYYRFSPRLFKSACHIVFISRHLADTIRRKIPVEPYSIIHNPVDELYISAPINKGVTGKVLFAGNVKEYKGMDVLLETMAAAINKNKHLTLTVAGDGDVGKYKSRARRLGIEKHVAFPGKVPVHKMINLYDEADCVIAPSVWPEPFGRTIIEGMARKCIPIASSHGGPAEIITDGRNGFLCRPNDHEHFAEKIVSIYQDPLRRKQIRDAARADSIAGFSPSHIANEYESLFLSCTR